MKKFTFLKSVIFTVLLLIGNYSVYGQYTGTGVFTKITSVSQIESGAYYVLYGVNGSYSGAVTNTIYGGRMGATTVTLSGNTILNPSNTIVWKITGNLVNGYTIFNEAISKYCEITTNSTSGFSLSSSSNHTYTPTATTAADAIFFQSNSSTAGNRGILLYQTDFRPYTISNTNLIYVYKYVPTASNSVATPTFSVVGSEKEAGTYWNTAAVTLASTTDGASIYYSTNGDAPTTASTLYSAPFNVTSTATVKAIAVKSGMDNSSVAEKLITIATPAIATLPYAQAFNNTLGNWFSYQVAGAKPWLAQTTGAYANGFGGGTVDSWLLSPKFTATAAGLKMTFNYASKYVGNDLKVKYSSDYIGYGNPSTATWTDLKTIAAPTVQDDNYTIHPSGNIIVPTSGTVYFALVYAAPSSYSDFRITDMTVDVAPATPTIVVTEVAVPEMVAYAGENTTETVNVSGINLTEDIAAAVTGDNASLFELSINSISQTGGTAASTELTIKYKPTEAGSHTATLTLSSAGATNVVRNLTGTSTWKPLAAPVATVATASNASGFTANWDAVTDATEYQLDVYTKTMNLTSDLIISEYIEGSSYNKAIEIYNGTGATVDLSGYSIKKQANGVGDYANELVLSGNLANGDTYVIAYVSGSNSASAGILAVTDLETSSSAVNYNGNDAVALFKGTTQIDEVGVFNQATNWGTDVTLIRKSTILSPKVPYDVAEWDSNPIDYIDNLGMHSTTTATPIANSPFTVTGATSKAISGLDAGTTYYYTVKAKNTHVTSAASNEIMANTATTSLDNTQSDLNLIAVNGNVKFSALAGQTVEVYNAIGQKLVSKITVEGLNTIPVSARGVVLVKVGSKIAKVIM